MSTAGSPRSRLAVSWGGSKTERGGRQPRQSATSFTSSTYIIPLVLFFQRCTSATVVPVVPQRSPGSRVNSSRGPSPPGTTPARLGALYRWLSRNSSPKGSARVTWGHGGVRGERVRATSLDASLLECTAETRSNLMKRSAGLHDLPVCDVQRSKRSDGHLKRVG